MLFRRWVSFKNSSALKRPALDIKGIISQNEQYKSSIERRQDFKRLESLKFVVENRPNELEITNGISKLKHDRRVLGDPKTDPSVKDKLKAIKNELRDLEKDKESLSEAIYEHAESLPNLLDCSVPEDPFEEQLMGFVNCESEQDAQSQKPISPHNNKSIAEKFKLVELSVASRVSGSSWYYLINDGALLEQALIQYGLAKARKKGYTLVSPPTVVKSEVINACGFKPKDQNGEQQIYEIQDSDLALIGTAEVPLGALHSSSILRKLPIKYVGISRSYRAEAGARGKDTKGLYRVHEFTKLELFHFTSPESSQKELEEIRQFQEEIIKDLGLMAKIINMPASDLGAPALKKYDIEAWMPGRGLWGELTSSSNCGDYQSRRLGIRYEENDKSLKYTHTLNGTCIAVPRVIVAILEQNFDEKTNSILIPEPLRPYMDGRDRIYSM